MGLDIRVIRKISRSPDQSERKDWGYNEGIIWLSPVPAFLAASDFIRKGWYEHGGLAFQFRAGSYGGYNDWRSSLALMIGKTDFEIWADPVPGPFVELINNSDCDGIIGQFTCRKLYADFREYLPVAGKYHTSPVGYEWFLEQYLNWMKAFSIASDTGGVVIFS